MVVAATEAGTEVLGLSIQGLVAYFYSDNGIVDSTQLERLHQVLEVPKGLFDQVVPGKNKRKAVSMAYQPCHTPGRMLVEAYEVQTTGMGPNFWERQRSRLECLECVVEVAVGSLLTHRHI